jgi:hypothetical protein
MSSCLKWKGSMVQGRRKMVKLKTKEEDAASISQGDNVNLTINMYNLCIPICIIK